MNCCRGTGGRSIEPTRRSQPDPCTSTLPRQDHRPVARKFGADVDFLFDVAIEMEPEDGLIWVLGLGDESVMTFTDDAVDSLVELIKPAGK